MEQSGLASQLNYEQQRAFRQSELLFGDGYVHQQREITAQEKKVRNQQILKEFFAQPIAENAIKRVQGVHMPAFNGHLEKTYRQLQDFDPQLGTDCFAAPVYRSSETQDVMSHYTFRDHDRLRAILRTHRRGLSLVANEVAARTSHLTIPRGVLANPPYYSQEDGMDGTRECFNACFRMVFNDLTGLDATQAEARWAMDTVGNRGTVDDQEYLKVFTDPGFSELSGRACKVVDFIGTDLGVLGKTAQAIRSKRPDAKVYAVVSLLSETGTREIDHLIWHTGILLHADDKHVTLHDPKEFGGRAARTLAKDEFLSRWGMAFNSARLIIAA